MLVLLVVLVFILVAMAHRCLALYAPSNRLIRTARWARQRWLAAAGLIAGSCMTLLLMRGLTAAVSAGAPGWVNLVVVVLGWDAIKFTAAAVGIGFGFPQRRRQCGQESGV